MNIRTKRKVNSEDVMQSSHSAAHTAHSPLYLLGNSESVNLHYPNKNLSSTLLPPQCVPQKSYADRKRGVSNHSLSPTSQKRTLCCSDLPSSSLRSTRTDERLGILPFTPHITTDDCADSPFINSFFEGGEPANGNLSSLLDLLDIPIESPVGCFHLGMAEKQVLQYISKELDIPVDDEIKNPAIDHKIDQVPKESATPVTDSDCNEDHHLSQFTRRANQAASFHKQRIRWTPELHDLFLDAVKSLGGPEIATPKKILGAMKVKSLSIYHVKSHLQKYRLAKNEPEMNQDTKSSHSLEIREANNEADVRSDGDVTEALRMQIELQKLLHDQLKSQRELQQRIEQNGELLIKLMEGQHNAIPVHDNASFLNSMSKSDHLSSGSTSNAGGC